MSQCQRSHTFRVCVLHAIQKAKNTSWCAHSRNADLLTTRRRVTAKLSCQPNKSEIPWLDYMWWTLNCFKPDYYVLALDVLFRVEGFCYLKLFHKYMPSHKWMCFHVLWAYPVLLGYGHCCESITSAVWLYIPAAVAIKPDAMQKGKSRTVSRDGPQNKKLENGSVGHINPI